MGNIFDDEILYPYQGKLKEHFKGHYNAVFIALLPFFQLDKPEYYHYPSDNVSLREFLVNEL